MKALAEQIIELDGIEIYSRGVWVRGLMVEVAGPLHVMSVGARLIIETQAQHVPCEVVGFTGDNALLMPFAALEGVRRGRDETIRLHKPLEAFLAQGKEEATSLAEGYRRLAEIVAGSETER